MPDTAAQLVDWPALIAAQAGAVTRAQARAHGQSDAALAAHLAAGRWQRAGTGVYVTFTGPLPVETARWIALLGAGPDAVMSHQTAAELWGLRGGGAPLIHVTVPLRRMVDPRPGVAVHRSRQLPRTAHPTATPPRTTVEATVFDLAASSARIDDTLALIAKACQSGRTNHEKLTAELKHRPTQRRRKLLVEAITDSAGGAHSLLELRYLRDVERAHKLPQGCRQRPVGGTRQDVGYDKFGTVVELDGRLGHSDVDGAWRDMARDNASTLRGEATLRFGWAEITARPCAVAAQVAAVLRSRGWRGTPQKCAGSCGL